MKHHEDSRPWESARPTLTHLDAYVAAARDLNETLRHRLGALVDAYDRVVPRLQWGVFDARAPLEALATYIGLNDADDEWVATIAARFRAADSTAVGAVALDDAAIDGALRAAGVAIGAAARTSRSTTRSWRAPRRRRASPLIRSAPPPGTSWSGRWTWRSPPASRSRGGCAPTARAGWSRVRSVAAGRRGRRCGSKRSTAARWWCCRTGGGRGSSATGPVGPCGCRVCARTSSPVTDGWELRWFDQDRWSFDRRRSSGRRRLAGPRHRDVPRRARPPRTDRARGRAVGVARVVAAAGSARCGRATGGSVRYRYDDAGDLVEVVGPGPWPAALRGRRRPRGRGVDADGVELVRNGYDPEGRVRWQRSPFGRRTTFRYPRRGVTVVARRRAAGRPSPTCTTRPGGSSAWWTTTAHA